MSTDTTTGPALRDAQGAPSSPRGGVAFDVQKVRRDFPILSQRVHGKPLVYLDNAATTQKPQAVIDAMVRSYAEDNANIHRGVHLLSERATRAYEEARGKVQRFLNAANAREIIFVRGTTEAINLVAQTFGRVNVRSGDEVLITEMEHHSNIVPWQLLCEEKGAQLKVLPITDEGELRMDLLDDMLTDRTRIVAVVHVSNSLGTVNPIESARPGGVTQQAGERGTASSTPRHRDDADTDRSSTSSPITPSTSIRSRSTTVSIGCRRNRRW